MKNIFLNKKFLATGIGSLPHKDPREASQFIIESFKDDIIFWPQLPKVSFYENMYVQFSQGLPGVVIDKEKKGISIDTSQGNFLQELESTYQAYTDDNLDFFSIGKEYASGLYAMLEKIKQLNNINLIKGQVIGPVSFALSVKDQNQQAVIYNSDIFEIVTKVLSMKAKWQIKKFKQQNPKLKIIIFIDEPYLVSIGSSYVSLQKQQVISSINEVIKSIREEGALAGIHCCGNTDWSVILETDLDILSFDAYNYLDNLLLYKHELEKFLEERGVLAWGIVPTNQDVASKDLGAEKLSQKISLTLKERKLSSDFCIITPSCGCGTISSVELAEKIHQLSVEIAGKLAKAA